MEFSIKRSTGFIAKTVLFFKERTNFISSCSIQFHGEMQSSRQLLYDCACRYHEVYRILLQTQQQTTSCVTADTSR